MNDLLRIGSAFLPTAEGHPLCAGCPLLLAGTRAAPRLGSGDDSVFTAVFYKRGKWCSRLRDLLKVTLPMTAGPRPELHGPLPPQPRSPPRPCVWLSLARDSLVLPCRVLCVRRLPVRPGGASAGWRPWVWAACSAVWVWRGVCMNPGNSNQKVLFGFV